VHPTEFPRDFHSVNSVLDGELRSKMLVTARNGMAFRFKEALNSAHAEAEDKKLRKELKLWRSLL
jgi:hypothetical protein